MPPLRLPGCFISLNEYFVVTKEVIDCNTRVVSRIKNKMRPRYYSPGVAMKRERQSHILMLPMWQRYEEVGMNQKRDRKGRRVRIVEECIRHDGTSVVGDASAQGQGPQLEGET